MAKFPKGAPLPTHVVFEVGYEKAVHEIVDYLRNTDLGHFSISVEAREALAKAIDGRFKMVDEK